MKLSNLRVNTSPSDTVPLLSNALLSDATWPQVATNHSVSLQEQQQNPTETENSHTMIRRTFSFDEWDEEIAYDHKIRSTSEDSLSNNSENEINNEIEQELQYTIRRSFAFDEWDEERTVDNETASATPNGRFAPIQTNSDVTEHSPTKLPSFGRYDTKTTKFDLDESNIQSGMAVTPSPPPKLQRPVPLYSQQSIDFAPNRFESTTPSTPSQREVLQNDLHCLESMIRASFVPSIPRKASAFSIPTGNRDSFPAVSIHDVESDENGGDGAATTETHWFDMHGSGTTLFEDDDYVFESPTLSDEDSLFSASTIPRFIVCYQDNE